MRLNRGVSFEGTSEDTLRLEAEIIELKRKDTAVENATANWAGKGVERPDLGKRLQDVRA
ncbi:MAG: hypothetical protein IKO41_16925, partial [Lachnospiraceae bacterium]|nr:hypothetical protein [Lachnospiraceae bacterium]